MYGFEYEQAISRMIEQARALQKVSPLILGGIGGASGGIGGPVGGVQGKLTQGFVAYDTTELAEDTPATLSGESLPPNASLVTNLNKIRYNIQNLDAVVVGLPDYLQLDEQSGTPTTPEAGKMKFYYKNDGKLYYINDTGTETEVGSGSGGSGGGGDPYWFIEGTLATATRVGITYVVQRAFTLESATIQCDNAGSAGSTIVDVNKNGTTIFTTQANRPTLAYNDVNGQATSGTPNVIDFIPGDEITFAIDQVATGAADLSIFLKYATTAPPFSGEEVNGALSIIGDQNEPQLVIKANSSQDSPIINIKNSANDEIMRIDSKFKGVFIGKTAGEEVLGEGSVGVGLDALRYSWLGHTNTAVGYWAMKRNKGYYSVGVGQSAGLQNLGTSNIAIGRSAGLFTGGDDNIAIGGSAYKFAPNVSGTKSFSYSDMTEIPGESGLYSINIDSHGFGSASNYVHLRYEEGTSPITGINDTVVYLFRVVDVNNIRFVEDNYITSVGTGTGHTLTPQFKHSNSIAIGKDTEVTSSNQVVLGNDNVTETKLKGEITLANKKITNLAPGTNPTDAVNKSQLGGIPVHLNPTMVCHYDGLEPYNTNFYGQANGHRGQVATVTGGVNFRPGKFGKAVQIAEAGTNLIKNPSMLNGTTEYQTYGTNTVVSSSEQALFGTNSLKVTYQDSVFLIYSKGMTLTAQPYTFSASVFIPSSYDGTALIVSLGGFDGAIDVVDGFADMSIRDEWQRISCKATPNVGDLYGYPRIITYSPDVPSSGKFFYTDGWLLEQKSYLTPYFDGSMPGCSWTGTAHASTSTRTAGNIKYASSVINPEKGSISFWVHNTNNPNGVVDQGIIDASSAWSGTNYFAIWQHRSGYFIFPISDAHAVTPTGLVDVGDTYNLTCTWEKGDYSKIYINGELVGTSSGVLVTPPVLANQMTIGLLAVLSNRYFNDAMDDLAIFDRALTAEEVKAIYESNAPLFTGTDFSEGTWYDYTATLSADAGSAGAYSESQVYSRFCIIGRQCHLEVRKRVDNKGSWSGNIRLNLPLPYAGASGQAREGPLCWWANGGAPGSPKAFVGFAAGTSQYMTFTDGLNASFFTWADMTTLDTLLLSISYPI